MKSLVIIPTFQEAENIATVIGRVRRAVPAAMILVADDSSPDGTGDIVAALEAADDHVHLLRRPMKAGLGAAYRAGFEWGSARGFEIQVEMDADLSHDPAALPELLAAVHNGADLAIGSRYVPGGSIPDWPWYRKALSRWGNRYVDAMLHLGVADATAGFRAYRTTLLDRLDLATVTADGYGFQIEMTYRSTKRGAVITEIPIAFTDRTHGESKMSTAIVIEAFRLVTRWGIQGRLGRLGRRRLLAD